MDPSMRCNPACVLPTAGSAEARMLDGMTIRVTRLHARLREHRQAVQLFYFLFMLNGHDSPGRMDQFLWPPLKRELQERTTTVEALDGIVKRFSCLAAFDDDKG